MTTITLPRAVVEQVLEALEKIYRAPEREEYNRVWWPDCEDAITALRAALAQQAERFCDTHCTWADHAAGCVRAEPVQEPVAWMTHGNDLLPLFHKTKAGALVWGAEPLPLYTTPPQRKPLTEEEAATLVVQDNRMRGEFSAAMELIRRTERAHGIKE